jgi:hypothetical protein
MYPLSLVIGGHAVTLNVVANGSDERKLELCSGGMKHVLSFSPYYTPAYEGNESGMAIWGGVRLYVFDVIKEALQK